MASSGIRRKVDDLGRVVIPAGIRRTLGIREGDAIEVTVEGERVVLAKPRDACVFCGREEEDLSAFRGRLVCRDCLASLGRVEERLRSTAQAAGRPATPGTPEPSALPAWDAPPRRRSAEPSTAPRASAGPRARSHSEGRGDDGRRATDEEREDERRVPGARRPPYDLDSTTAW